MEVSKGLCATKKALDWRIFPTASMKRFIELRLVLKLLEEELSVRYKA
jgi:hypothetical protein